jgi:predicted phage terminase large subunit-like protein
MSESQSVSRSRLELARDEVDRVFGNGHAAAHPELVVAIRERSAYVARTSFPTRGDKAIRAQSIRGRMALEGLYVPVNAPWYPDFRAELLSFPAGRHDDQADALGLVGQLLDLMVRGSKPAPPEKPEVDIGYKDALGETSAEDWMQW